MFLPLLKLSPYFIEFGTIRVYWYAVLILSGAVLAYYISRYFAMKDGVKGETIENIFFVAFPSGLIGTRIWYVLSNLDQMNPWYRAFFLWEGGLAIQGGIIFGGIATYYFITRIQKKVSFLKALDYILPNVLIAQAIGRWGNFFNQEVYGACVPRTQLSFLPDFILDQMAGGGGIACAVTQVAQPLFLYEGLLNLAGFILISLVLRKYWTKRPVGVLGSLYFIHYGIVRAVLEPLRNPIFIMEIASIPTSLVTAIGFVIFGALLIGYLYYKPSKTK
jgi:phosphatidylglycerol---prolipoprotein diacylglyceryl transferase